MKKNLKTVLLIHPSLGIGGAEKMIAFVANSLCKQYKVKILLLQQKQQTLPLLPSIFIKTIPCYVSRPLFGKQFLSVLKSIKQMGRNISAEISSCNPQLVICFDLRVLLALSLACNLKSINILFSERADPFANRWYWAFILRFLYKRVKYLVFQTQGASDFYGIAFKNKTAIIANPAFPRTLSVPPKSIDKKFIFAAGRFQYRKGFDLLIHAFAFISSKYPAYELFIYGSGEEQGSLENLIKSLHLTKRIHLLPPENGIVEKNVQASLFVLPSRSEGIPNILLEAMVAGIPTVSSNCSPGGAKLITDNGKYGILVDSNDALALAKGIEEALEFPEQMKEMAKRAKLSLTRFDKDKIAAQWLGVVDMLLDGREKNDK